MPQRLTRRCRGSFIVAVTRVMQHNTYQRHMSVRHMTQEDMTMIKLCEKDTGDFIGVISEEQLQFLIDQLEEESTEDSDYYIDHDTLDLFEALGADADLLGLLHRALGTRDDLEIQWSRA